MAASTVLLTTLGSDGDTRPFVAIAQAFIAQNIRPVALVNPSVCDAFNAVGCEAIPVGEAMDLPRLIRENPRYMSIMGPQHVLREIYIPYIRELFDHTEDLIEKESPAAVVSQMGCWGSIWAAQRAKVPNVVVHFSPASLGTAETYTYAPAWQQTCTRLFLPLGIRIASRWFKPTCKALGIPWHRHLVMDTMTKADLLLGLWSRHFLECKGLTGMSPQVCGFPYLDKPTVPFNGDLQNFLDSGPPPVAFAFGSTVVHLADKLYTQGIRICLKQGRRALLIGCPDDVTTEPSPNVKRIAHTEYRDLFPHCSTVIHHGGMGTSAEALRAGVPAIIVPFGHDQFDNANRLQAKGVAKVLYRHRFVRRLEFSLRTVDDNGIRHQSIQLARDLYAEGNGAEAAVERIVWLIQSGNMNRT
jgi:UDP:flavonoid glycosyltransferase YjiC (YdhE family)